jgi:hypothetical protein
VTSVAGEPLPRRGGSGHANRADSVDITIFDKPDASVDALDIKVALGDDSVCCARVRRP